jgi:hypothetical protein
VSRRTADLAGRLALLVAAPLALLAALEALAFALGSAPRASQPGFEERRKIEACRWSPEALERCEAGRFPRIRRRQVFVYGGSSVVGHPFGERRTIVAFLQQELDAAYPLGYRVRNVGSPCKDSLFVSRCLERSLDSVEAAVVYTGHNDFGGYLLPRPRVALWVREHLWLLRLRDVLAHTRLYSLLSRSPAGDPRPAILRPDPDWDFEGSKRIVLAEYRRNIERTADLAAARGVPLVVVTVVGNLSEFPFRRRAWDTVLERVHSQTDPPRWLAEFARGIELERAGERAASLAAFRRSRDLHFPATRAGSALNEVLRDVAARREGVHLVDFERELDALGLEEGIGCNFFGTRAYCDGVHPNPRTNELIARAVFRKLDELQRSPASLSHQAGSGRSLHGLGTPAAQRGAAAGRRGSRSDRPVVASRVGHRGFAPPREEARAGRRAPGPSGSETKPGRRRAAMSGPDA